MRIIHVDSALTWRGGQNQVLLTAQGMQRLGHEVTLVARCGSELEARAHAAGTDTFTIGVRGDFSPRASLKLNRLIRNRQPDIIHAHDAHALSIAMTAMAMGGSGSLIAARRVDFHLRSSFSRFKYRCAKRIIAASRAIASVLETDGILPEGIRVVYEGVPDRAPQPGGKELLREMGIPEDSPVIGNIAALTDHKDHRTLIDAASIVLERYGDARFVIAGEGECRPALERRILETGLHGKILLLGFRRDIDRLLPAFTIFCLSSHLEGLGTSLLDAMAFGLPIAATRAGGIPEAVDDGVTGSVVPARDPSSLAAALMDLLENKERREAMGRAGRAAFERRFIVDRMIENTLAVYNELR
jgi:glycosyltransferase involved in cell wall biosynthesis